MLASAVVLSAFTGETAVVTAENADELVAQITAATGIPVSALTSLLSVTEQPTPPSGALEASQSQSLVPWTVRWVPYTFATFQAEATRLQNAASPHPFLFESLSTSAGASNVLGSGAVSPPPSASWSQSAHRRAGSQSVTPSSLGALIPHAGEMPLLVAFDRRWFSAVKRPDGGVEAPGTPSGGGVGGGKWSPLTAIPALQPETLQLPTPSGVDVHDLDEEERHLASAFLFITTHRSDIRDDMPASELAALLPPPVRLARETRRALHVALEVSRALGEGATERAQSVRLAALQLQRQCLAARAAAEQTIQRCQAIHDDLKQAVAVKAAAFKDAAATSALAPLIAEELRRVPLHPAHVQVLRAEFSDARSLFDVLPQAMVTRLLDSIPGVLKKTKVSLTTLVRQLESLLGHLNHLRTSMTKHECAAVYAPSSGGQQGGEPGVFVGGEHANALWSEARNLTSLQLECRDAIQQAYLAAVAHVKALLSGAGVPAGNAPADAESVLEAMRARDSNAAALQRQAHSLLLQNANLLSRHLQYMSVVQSEARACQELDQKVSAEVEELRHMAAELLNLQDLPRSYNALVLETVRRTAFKNAYLQAVERAEKELAALRDDEVRLREQFRLRHGMESVPPPLLVSSAQGANGEPVERRSVVVDPGLPEMSHATLSTPFRIPAKIAGATGSEGVSHGLPVASPMHATPSALGRVSPNRPMSPTGPKSFSGTIGEMPQLRIATLEAELASVLAVARVPPHVATRYATLPMASRAADERAVAPASPSGDHPVPANAEATPDADTLLHVGRIVHLCESALTAGGGDETRGGGDTALSTPVVHLLKKAEEVCGAALASYHRKVQALQADVDELHKNLRSNNVAISAFAAGANALFLPVGKLDDNGVRVYLAFNIGSPHYYLDPESAKRVKNKGRWPDFVVGRIAAISAYIVPADAGAAPPRTPDSVSSSPRGSAALPQSSRSPHTPPVTVTQAYATASTSPALGGVVDPSIVAAASSPGSNPVATDTPDVLHLGPPAVPQPVTHPSGNPFHLHAGTLFHVVKIESFASVG